MNKLARATSTYDDWKTREPDWMEGERDGDRRARRRFTEYLAKLKRQHEEEHSED